MLNILIIFIIIIIIILLIYFYFLLLDNFVKKNSLSLILLEGINKRYNFKTTPNLLEYSCDNEKMYSQLSCLDYLIYELQFIKNEIMEEINNIHYNRDIYKKYQEEIGNTQLGRFKKESKFFPKNLYLKIEKKLFNSLIKKPSIVYQKGVQIIKTNINGERLNKKIKYFSEEQILDIIKKLANREYNYNYKYYFYKDQDIWEAIERIERSKVTNKLRFYIYKRDGYRCKCCGRSGTKTDLEIDHIIPIAKGGKSKIDNLQTLCRKCNKMKGTNIIKY